jgi:hypothetical protein
MAEQLSLFKDNTARDAALRRIRQQLDSNEKIHLVSAKSIIRNGIRTTSTLWSNGYTDTLSERIA